MTVSGVLVSTAMQCILYAPCSVTDTNKSQVPGDAAAPTARYKQQSACVSVCNQAA
jgi:hypothetical protein